MDLAIDAIHMMEGPETVRIISKQLGRADVAVLKHTTEDNRRMSIDNGSLVVEGYGGRPKRHYRIEKPLAANEWRCLQSGKVILGIREMK